MLRNSSAYTPDDQLRLLIEENPNLLGVLSRFGLSFGFGDKRVKDACKDDGVDLNSFLAVCNFLCGRNYSAYPISLPALMNYLRKAHVHFLDYLLPSIRRKLIEAINHSDISDVAFLLLKFYDDYVSEVHNHMQHENDDVFSYVSRLLSGEISENFRIRDYSLNHVSMTKRLNELKDVFIRHYHVKDNEILTSALIDIIYCGNELNRHCEIENILFIPEVEKLEKSLKLRALENVGNDNVESESKNDLVDILSDREKEIICCVAKGMINKEIADKLCLSVHTVTTHRRNILSKLQIHSTAGLTIFAILNNLIDINEVNLHL
ncbi:MAG: response regulator transcription factor [Bacteroidales bacterium]|nr:response regulator transcription factor [Bacteroidales bacterium]MDE5809595.1 LuxR C-terminal-related transcriptional regulator [Muribaculaceae bacterium]